MHVLVIGGTRYMGRLAVQRLLARGDRVTVFSRGNARPDWWDRIEHIAGDRDDHQDFAAKMRGRAFDAVIDLQAFRREHVETACQVFSGSAGRYLMVSTGSVYADGKLDLANHCPYKETDVDWTDLDYTYPAGEDPYGVGKRHCEKWLQENRQLPYTIVRIPAVMGWDDPTGRMWWWVQRALDGGGVLVPAENRAPFRTLYADDAAANFLRALDAPGAAYQTYHISMQEIMTMERWTRLLWAAAGGAGQITYLPGEIIQRQPALKDYVPPLSRPLPYIQNLSKAEREFGFQVTPVEQWIKTTVDWYRTQYQGDDSKGYAHRQTELKLAEKWQRDFAQFISKFEA